MPRILHLVTLSLATLSLATMLLGCGPTASPGGGSTSDPTVAIQTVVETFWSSVRAGDTKKVFALLSPAAQKCIRDNNYDFQLPSSPTMRFQIEGLELVDGQQAIADTVLTELDSDGQAFQEEASLALRKVDDRWCIIGIAGSEGPGQPLIVMNLESAAEFYGQQATPAHNRPRPATQTAAQTGTTIVQ